VLVQDEIYWISLTERKHANDKGPVYKAPIFVAHFPGQPYFFVSHSGKKKDILDVRIVALKPLLLNVHTLWVIIPCTR
jgi:hypothetical protein